MGEIADLMVDGTLCEQCGVYIGSAVGYPRLCDECETEKKENELSKISSSHCHGCYNEGYNHGLGGSHECWSLSSAKLIMRKEVHINDVPPWNKPEHKAKLLPSCYRKSKYVYVEPDRTC